MKSFHNVLERRVLSTNMVAEWIFLVIRVGLAAWCCTRGDVLSFLLGFADLVRMTGALRNVLSVRDRDYSRWALLVPICYLLPLLLTPTGPRVPGVGAALLFLLAFVISLANVAVGIWFGIAYTIGRSSFARGVDTGPYRFVRHPQLSLAIFSVLALLLVWPSARNVALVLLFLGSAVVQLAVEERFLFSVDWYRNYAHRVRWRIIPGVL